MAHIFITKKYEYVTYLFHLFRVIFFLLRMNTFYINFQLLISATASTGDYYDSDDYKYEDESNSTNYQMSAVETPVFISNSKKISVNEGDKVKLACQLENLGIINGLILTQNLNL